MRSRNLPRVQLKRLVAQDDFGGACCSRLGWKDMVAVLKSALQDLKAGDRRSDCHLKCSAVYSITREATSILERAASLAPYRLSVRFAYMMRSVLMLRAFWLVFASELVGIHMHLWK